MIIVAILGKSGSGKSTLERAFENIGFNRMISYTTRNMREHEQNHREYHFVSREQFEKLIQSGILIEWAEYNGNMYGSAKPVGSDKNVIVVEPNGMNKLKELYGRQVVSVYLDTPESEIQKRLDRRNNTPDRDNRKQADIKKFSDIKSKVDLVLDGMKKPTQNVVSVLQEITVRG